MASFSVTYVYVDKREVGNLNFLEDAEFTRKEPGGNDSDRHKRKGNSRSRISFVSCPVGGLPDTASFKFQITKTERSSKMPWGKFCIYLPAEQLHN